MEIILFFFLLPVGIIIIHRYLNYRDSDYKNASGNSFFKTLMDRGNYGEFLTFSYLEKLEGYNKLMTNLYLPKKDGSTTEIDLVMLSEAGIYVFESKNYSGWIFGDEKNKNWTQTLPNKQKNSFFNPIWQNKGHIAALKSIVEINDDNFYKSYIVFSERCTLKKISVNTANVKVVKRNNLSKEVEDDIKSSRKLMTMDEVIRIYLKLQRYACADVTVKNQHIDNIKAKRA